MRHRPEATMPNGCGPVACAALLGGSVEEHAEHVERWRGHFVGMTNDEIRLAFYRHGSNLVHTFIKHRRQRRLLRDALPLDGRGIASVMWRGRYHALAFDGKMVYDTRSEGRWMWVYDHWWGDKTVRTIMTEATR